MRGRFRGYYPDVGIAYTLLRQVWLLARREEGAYPLGSVTDEQRSQEPKSPQPFGQRVFWPGASLLARHRSLRICSSLAPSSRPISLFAECILSHRLSSSLVFLRVVCGRPAPQFNPTRLGCSRAAVGDPWLI